MLSRKTLLLLAAAFTLAVGAPRASAQDIAVFGSAEAAGDETLLFLLGGAWSPGGLGFKPYVSAIGYNLRFDAGNLTISRNVFAPQAGLRYQRATGAVQVGAGWAFTSDTASVTGGPVSTGEGLFGAFQWNYWGTGRRSAELIASYGTDDEFLWSRLTGFQRLTPTSPLHVGAEGAFYGSASNPSFWTAQVGPAIEFHFTPAFRIGAAAGFKIQLTTPSPTKETDAYGRLSFLWLPALKY